MKKNLLISVVLASLLTGCLHSSTTHYALSRLYFGFSTPAGILTQPEFERFVDEEITPAFPDGLTRIATTGQWRNSDGKVIREPGALVEIVHSDTRENAAKIDTIIQRYKNRYKQESVLLLREYPQVQF